MSSSDWRVSGSASATCSADSRLQPPTKTLSRRNSACSSGVEQVMAPGDRCLEGRLPGIDAPAGPEEVKPLRQTFEQLGWAEHDRPSRRELERERQIVEASAQRSHHVRIRDRHAGRSCPTAEECLAVGWAHRRHRVDLLAGEAQALPRGHHRGHGRTRGNEVCDRVGGIRQEMLGVVEQQEQSATGEAAREVIDRRASRALADTERCRNRRQDTCRIP